MICRWKNRSALIPRRINAERCDFLTPEQSPILSFSACLAQNPDALKLETLSAAHTRRNARRAISPKMPKSFAYPA